MDPIVGTRPEIMAIAQELIDVQLEKFSKRLDGALGRMDQAIADLPKTVETHVNKFNPVKKLN